MHLDLRNCFSWFSVRANMYTFTSTHSPYTEDITLTPQEATVLFLWSVILLVRMTSWLEKKNDHGLLLIWIRSEERQRQVESLHQVTSLRKINPAVIFLWHFWCSWVYPIALGRPTAYCWTMIVHWDNWHRPVCFMLFNTTSTTQLTTVTCSCPVSVALEPSLHYWLYSSSSYIYLKGPQINLCVFLHHNHPMKSVIPEILSLPFLSIFLRQNYYSFHFLTVSITPASAFWGLYF